MRCPDGLEFSQLVQGCTEPDLALCPSDDLNGYVEAKLIKPERVVHDACGNRQKNGDYLIYDKVNFTTPDLCGYKQVC